MGIEFPHLVIIIGSTILLIGLVCALQIVKQLRSFGVVYNSTGILKKTIFFKFCLVMLAGLFLAVAFSNPYYTGGAKAESSVCVDAIVLNDDSVSMTAHARGKDLSRIDRAKIIAFDLVKELGCANISVCEFTDKVFCRAGFGSSATLIQNIIEDFSADAISGSGSEIGSALVRLAIEFPEDSAEAKFIFLVSDGGEELSNDQDRKELNSALDHMLDNEITVMAIGVGEDYDVPVALVPIKDPYGIKKGDTEIDGTKYNIIRSKLEENKLKHIAAKTGGAYIHEDEFDASEFKSLVAFNLEGRGLIKPVTTSLSGVFIGAVLVCLFLYGVFFKPSFRKK